ncbi:MAG: ParB/RepB/Spo0J family partition protein [Brevirhabdus sp.]
MAEKKSERRGLGRGLSALMADVDMTPATEGEAKPRRADTTVGLDRIVPNPDQPRRSFNEDALADLTSSIKEKGIIQPLIVRVNPRDTSTYEIVAGERRWRAAQRAQLHDIPVIVRDLDDTEVLELAIIENIQRADLNPVEEAMGYRQLMDRFGHTQEKVAEALSKSRSYIANLLRLLTLPDDVQALLRDGSLSIGHARALITTENPSALAREVVNKGLSVREVEKLAKGPKTPAKPVSKQGGPKDADTLALQDQLSANLGLKVAIDHNAGGETGKLVLSYTSLDQLDALCALLGSSPLDVSR